MENAEKLPYQPPRKTTHPQVPINIRGHMAFVDEHLAPYIVKLNEEGFITRHSCQGNLAASFQGGYVSFSDGMIVRQHRLKIEEILDLPTPLPEYVTDPDGWLGVDVHTPYWELWPLHPRGEINWVVRFSRFWQGKR